MEKSEKEEFLFRYSKLIPYLQALGEDISKVKRQTVRYLKLVKDGDFSAQEVNGAKLDLQVLIEAALTIIMEEPRWRVFVEWNWVVENRSLSVKRYFEEFENYLKKFPWAKLPQKDPEVKAWWKKVEKEQEAENEKNERGE